MDYISAGIIALVFILLVVFTVLSAKTWHWVNIVFVNLTFLAGVGATIGLSQALHLRYEALQELESARELAEANQLEAERSVYGDPNSSSFDRDSLRGKLEEVALVMTGRGRVWSGGTVTVEGEDRVFRFVVPRPADETNQVKLKDVLLYAFADGNINGLSYPLSYIGSIKVSAESPESVTLQRDFIIDQQEWATPSTTWSLFEKMPLDRHDTFKMGIVAYVDANPDTVSEDDKAFAASILNDEMPITRFREVLQADYLKPELFNLDPASLEYEELIDRYAFDGLSLGKIQNWIDENAATRVSQRFAPPPEEVFIRYRFNKPSDKSKPYRVDSDSGTLETDGPFTELGQAVDKALHAGSDVTFAEGDTVLVDQRTAEGQRGNEQMERFDQREDVTEVDRIYLRQLRDFPYLFADIYRQTAKFEEEAQRVRATILVQEKSLADAEAQRQDRLATIAGLQQDQGNLKNDWDTIQELHSRREEDVRNLNAQITSLRKQIQENYNRIQELTRNIERQVYAGG